MSRQSHVRVKKPGSPFKASSAAYITLRMATVADECEALANITSCTITAGNRSELNTFRHYICAHLHSELRYFPQTFLGDVDGTAQPEAAQ